MLGVFVKQLTEAVCVMNKYLKINSLVLLLLISSCSLIEPKPFEISPGHIQDQPAPPGEIPELVDAVPPALPEPSPPVALEKYTVVVNEVPVKELLFALARDSKVNVDIDPGILGVVTLNAVDQTFPQILERISQQVDLRYEFQGVNLLVMPDKPYLKAYKIGYINMSRETSSDVAIATQIATTGGGFQAGGGTTGGGAGGGDNNSTTTIKNTSNNLFWGNLVNNVQAILEQSTGSAGGEASADVEISNSVIPNPETGILTVRATHRQHAEVQVYIDAAMESAHRQVLIQATILEVLLTDDYQAGVDWSFLDDTGISVISTTAGGPLTGEVASFVLEYFDAGVDGEDTVDATLTLLEEFGDINVLSSPQIMALNNQTAILKVVENDVFFTIESDTTQSQTSAVTTFTTTINTVPVGIVMSVTPQINDNDSIMLNIRPTISRIVRRVNDPNPSLTTEQNLIPVINVREMESLLRLSNGQIAVLGGLIENQERDSVNSIPGLSMLPFVGEAFKTTVKEYQKSELIIFLRPVIINNPTVDSDLDFYKPFLDSRRQSSGSESGAGSR